MTAIYEGEEESEEMDDDDFNRMWTFVGEINGEPTFVYRHQVVGDNPRKTIRLGLRSPLIQTPRNVPARRVRVISCKELDGFSSIRASHYVESGTFFFEVRPQMTGNGHVRVGFCEDRFDLNFPVGSDKYSFSYRDVNGDKFWCGIERGGVPYGAPYGSGDVIGCLIHIPARSRPMTIVSKRTVDVFSDGERLVFVRNSLKEEIADRSFIKFYKNGKSQGTAFTNIVRGLYYAAVSVFRGARAEFEFGPTFAYPPPREDVPDGKLLDYCSLPETASTSGADEEEESDDDDDDGGASMVMLQQGGVRPFNMEVPEDASDDDEDEWDPSMVDASPGHLRRKEKKRKRKLRQEKKRSMSRRSLQKRMQSLKPTSSVGGVMKTVAFARPFDFEIVDEGGQPVDDVDGGVMSRIPASPATAMGKKKKPGLLRISPGQRGRFVSSPVGGGQKRTIDLMQGKLSLQRKPTTTIIRQSSSPNVKVPRFRRFLRKGGKGPSAPSSVVGSAVVGTTSASVSAASTSVAAIASANTATLAGGGGGALVGAGRLKTGAAARSALGLPPSSTLLVPKRVDVGVLEKAKRSAATAATRLLAPLPRVQMNRPPALVASSAASSSAAAASASASGGVSSNKPSSPSLPPLPGAPMPMPVPVPLPVPISHSHSRPVVGSVGAGPISGPVSGSTPVSAASSSVVSAGTPLSAASSNSGVPLVGRKRPRVETESSKVLIPPKKRFKAFHSSASVSRQLTSEELSPKAPTPLATSGGATLSAGAGAGRGRGGHAGPGRIGSSTGAGGGGGRGRGRPVPAAAVVVSAASAPPGASIVRPVVPPAVGPFSPYAIAGAGMHPPVGLAALVQTQTQQQRGPGGGGGGAPVAAVAAVPIDGVVVPVVTRQQLLQLQMQQTRQRMILQQQQQQQRGMVVGQATAGGLQGRQQQQQQQQQPPKQQ